MSEHTETPMPMFPLQSVLVPAAPLPLQVFEARYQALMHDVMRTEAREFGVVMIERGSEVGGGDVRSRVGTVARILDAERAPDGRWGVIALGTRRVDVVEWLEDDPYPRALVVDRPDGPWTEEADAAVAEVEPIVRRALALKAEIGDPAPAATVELDDLPVTKAWQLVAVAPILTIDRHGLLRLDDPVERMRRLRGLVDEEIEALAHRLRGL